MNARARWHVVVVPIGLRLVNPHDDTLDYHEWVWVSRMQANVNGVGNPRMGYTSASTYACNNPDCPAWGVVTDRAAGSILDTESLR